MERVTSLAGSLVVTFLSAVNINIQLIHILILKVNLRYLHAEIGGKNA
jgi:hypothetical protein